MPLGTHFADALPKPPVEHFLPATISMNTVRINAILAYVLATAAESEDFREQQLGFIHLIKYIYLADLAYAEEHSGQTFTNIDWQFYRFGPWSASLYHHIPQALDAMGAEHSKYPSAYSDEDFDRWKLRNHDVKSEACNIIGVHICGLLTQLVHEFSNCTTDLLHFVYQTPPMLRAAPNEILDFSPSGWRYIKRTFFTKSKTSSPLTRKQEKRIKAWEDETREKIQAKLARLKTSRATRKPAPQAIYDEIYLQGIASLDECDLLPLPEDKVTAEISPNVWKSRARYDPDIPE